jgi:hypothetical protein
LFDDAVDDSLQRAVGASEVINTKPRAVAISEIELGRIYPPHSQVTPKQAIGPLAKGGSIAAVGRQERRRYR